MSANIIIGNAAEYDTHMMRSIENSTLRIGPSSGVPGTLDVTGNVVASGNVYGTYFYGNGSTLTGMTATSLVPTSNISIANVIASGFIGINTLAAENRLHVAGTSTLHGTVETLTVLTGSTGTVTHNYDLGPIWYHTGIAASFTANFTNLPTTSSRAISVALMLVQGATPYMCTAVQVEGVAGPTIKWASGVTPTGTANYVDVVSLTFLRIAGAWSVLGQVSPYY